jgi:DNA-binding Xre family transcriptional regulator
MRVYFSSMLDMRLRLPELMKAAGFTTAYQLARASAGRISMTKAYRLVESEGRPPRVDMETLEALCDVFNVGPGELLERDKPKRGKST